MDDPNGSWDCHSPVDSIGWLVITSLCWGLAGEASYGLSNRKNQHSSVLTVELFTEPSTLLFLCTPY